MKLCDRLSRDAHGRRYLNVSLLSHPDNDKGHCTGLHKAILFYLGPPDKPEKWSAEDDGIVWPIRGGSLAVSNIE